MRARELDLLQRHHWAGPAPAGFRQAHDDDQGVRPDARAPSSRATTRSCSPRSPSCFVLLAFLGVAETGINRISRHKAEALAHDHPRRGRALQRLVEAAGEVPQPGAADREHPADGARRP